MLIVPYAFLHFFEVFVHVDDILLEGLVEFKRQNIELSSYANYHLRLFGQPLFIQIKRIGENDYISLKCSFLFAFLHLLQSLFCDVNDGLGPFTCNYDIDIASLEINVDVIRKLFQIIDRLKVLEAQIQKDFCVNLVFVICHFFVNPNHFVGSSRNGLITLTQQKVIQRLLLWLDYN